MKTRRGFTLIEISIAIVMLSIVLAGALKLFRGVNTAVNGAVDRMDAMQNLRFGISQIDLLLRNAGAGTTDAQMTLVYVSSTMVVFNADWISLFPGSPTAVNYNPDADPASSNAPTVAQRFTIPTTSVQYPDSFYHTAAAASPAEVIMYWFELDTSTTRTDDYHLMRQVNNASPDEVARNFLPYPGHSFFEWLRTDAAGTLQQIPYNTDPALPWRHINPIHGSVTDTNTAGAYIDSVRALRVWVRATNGQTGAREILRSLVTTVRIPNAGLAKQRSCGDTPYFGKVVTSVSTGTPASPNVRIGWTAGTDEIGGEADIERYLIYRRTAAGTFDDALAEVPSGQAAYTYDDATAISGQTYVYGVTGLDCTPLESSMSVTAASVVVP